MSCSCSNSPCTCSQSISFASKTLDFLDLTAGKVEQFLLKFGNPLLPITSDTFTMVIKDSSGATAQTLTVGSGFTILSPLTLSGAIGPLSVGKYTHTIVWNITASGANPTIGTGRVIVKS